jgi:hypothetical protein
MARETRVLDFQTLKNVAQKHADDMNELIKKANEEKMEQAKARMFDFIDEAFGVLEVDVIITRYERLKQEMAMLESDFQRAVGKSQNAHTSMTLAEATNKPLLQRWLEQNEPRLPVAFTAEVREAADRHGLTLVGGSQLPLVTSEEVLTKLRKCTTEKEMVHEIQRSSLKVLQMCGVTVDDLRRLAEAKIQDETIPF